MKMKQLFTTALLSVAALSVQAATFIIDIDDASRVKFETGMTSASYVEQPLVNGDNIITQTGSEDFVLTPRAGYLIESITAYDAAGAAQEKSGWKYDSSDDSYKIYFLGSSQPSARYVVTTKVDDEQPATLTINFDNPEAVLNNSFKIGDFSYTPEAGTQTIRYKASKGKQFYMQLRPAVAEATLTLNGAVTAPAGVMANGTRTYKFNLSGISDIISVTTVMESTTYCLVVDDPSHIEAFYPDSATPLDGLEAGRNTLGFSYGSTLYIRASDGYRITGLANMEFNGNTDVYSHRFTDGDSGMEFNCTTEVYDKPVATFILNLDNDGYIGYTSGLPTNTFEAGDNVFELNLDKVTDVTLNYSYRYDGLLMGSLNGVPFAIEEPENYWESYSSTFGDFVAGETYRVVIRQIINGTYDGTVTCTPSEDYRKWTLAFEPAGIIELDESAGLPAVTDAVRDAGTPFVEVNENDVVISFSNGFADGNHTFSVPAGMLKVNGGTVDAISQDFLYEDTGVSEIEADGIKARYFNLQGMEISEPADGQTVIVIRGNKPAKAICRK